MSDSANPTFWIIARQRIVIDVYWLPALWAVFAAVVVAVTAAFATFATISASAWETASALPRWYMGGTGVYLTAVYLPLYIAHGLTRRQFMSQLPVFMVAIVTALALLMTAGYAAEMVIYRVLDWPQALAGTHLFTAPTEYHLVLAEFWLIYFVWVTAGALAGAAFYRSGRLGAAVVPLALLMLVLAERAVGMDALGPISLLVGRARATPFAVAVAVCFAVIGIGLAATWAIVRAMPVRSKKA